MTDADDTRTDDGHEGSAADGAGGNRSPAEGTTGDREAVDRATGDGAAADQAAASGTTPRGRSGEDVEALREELARLRRELEAFEEDVEERTVDRDRVEADLRRYVRRRVRRGHARGWGPYLVLLYGTAMTLGAFYWLGGGWAILAMLVVWLSTLGLYTLMVLFGIGAAAVQLPGRLRDAVGSLRS